MRIFSGPLIRSSHAAALNLLFILQNACGHSDTLIAGDIHDDEGG